MDKETRHRRIAQRFLISILQRYGPDAPDVLRAWADELEELGREARGDCTDFRTIFVRPPTRPS